MLFHTTWEFTNNSEEAIQRNLAFFSIYFGFSAPLFWFNYVGPENLLLAGALVLLIVARWRGGMAPYAAALALVGVIPLIKLTGGMIAGAASDRALSNGYFFHS